MGGGRIGFKPHPAPGCVTPGPSGSPLTASNCATENYISRCAEKCTWYVYKLVHTHGHQQPLAQCQLSPAWVVGASSKPYPHLLLGRPPAYNSLRLKVESLESCISWKLIKSSGAERSLSTTKSRGLSSWCRAGQGEVVPRP